MLKNDTKVNESSFHVLDASEVFTLLSTSQRGLSHSDATSRLNTLGSNTIPKQSTPGVMQVFLRQFASPLIYILSAAALISLFIQQWADALFISAVLIINALIGTVQEHSAQQAAESLHKLITRTCRVIRENDTYVIRTEDLVPGDIILLEPGDKIPADIRLIETYNLAINESLLTGESVSTRKDAGKVIEHHAYVGERSNMAFAGTTIERGHATGVVTSTGIHTELGKIASNMLSRPPPKAPLQIRMEDFTRWVAIIVAIFALMLALIALAQGATLTNIFFITVALAVSAIPEGLPVALTVALAIGMRRMAQRHVIIRRLIAVEALGSCTYIATDKTGTLTINELTANKILLPDQSLWKVTGSGHIPQGGIVQKHNEPLSHAESKLLLRLCQTAVLANDAFIGHRGANWTHQGDAVDVALLVMAHKAGIFRPEQLLSNPELGVIPFESESLFAASLHNTENGHYLFVKGAVEKILPMCNMMATTDRDIAINERQILQQAHNAASQGLRVLALASGKTGIDTQQLSEAALSNLTLIGLVTMIDPLRPTAKSSIAQCTHAGIKVGMITGDHPATAFAIGKKLELISEINQLVTGSQIREANTPDKLEEIISSASVFARIEPQQKSIIVESLQQSGHFVAVSGDGANDAPALAAAHVGIAMGKSGTDVARESADIVISNDDFSSIVAGVEEGRVAYANVRKVIFLLISTGAAELVLFTLALLTGQPLPLMAVQLLWLNLVTNGIQDIALAFEPAEGHELRKPPRSPQELIFNRLMIERVLISASTIGISAFAIFQWLLYQGLPVEEARNSTVLLMVLFENIHVFNCRSETRSVFTHNPLRNPLLLFGTLAAQMIHIGAMYTPWLNDVLQIQPVTFEHWVQLLIVSTVVLFTMEAHKFIRNALITKA